MNQVRKLRVVIVLGLLAALAACSTTSHESARPPLPASAKDRTVEDALQLKDDGKAGDAAGVMIQVSERAANDLRTQYLFEAGQLYLSVPDAGHARDVLQKLISAAPNGGYTKILKAQISLLDGKAGDAITALGSSPSPEIAPATKGLFWLTLAQADESCAASAATPIPAMRTSMAPRL